MSTPRRLSLVETGSLYVSTATKRYYPWRFWPWVILLQLLALLYVGNLAWDTHTELTELKAQYKLSRRLVWSILRDHQRTFLQDDSKKGKP